MADNFDIIPKEEMRVGDRALWRNGGDTDFGTIAKINRTTFDVKSSATYSRALRVDIDLIYKVIRFHKIEESND